MTQQPPSDAGLLALLAPRNVAVVGASPDPKRIRGKVLRTLIAGGYAGTIYPVNPSHETVQGLRAWPSIASLPETVDLAMVAVAPGLVLQALEECAAAGARAAVVFSAASAIERDGEAPLHEHIAAIARRTGMRVLGPNTEGFFNVAAAVAANFSIVVEDEAGAATRDLRDRRGVSIISHSGGLGFGLYSRARRMHLPIRHVVTTGNEADVEALEVVEYLVREGRTAAIMMFIEGFRRPKDFARAASLAADAGVPLIVMKVGRSDASRRAAISHTGHLTGAETAYDAMFARHGVIRVADPDEMVSIAAGFCMPARPRGRRVCVLTGTAGTGAWVADLCAMHGLEVPPLDPALARDIAAVIPESGAAVNPIDVTAGIVDDGGVTLSRVLDLLGPREDLDSVILIFSLAPVGRIAAFRPVIEAALSRLSKPLLFVSQTLPHPGNLAELADLGVWNFSFSGCAQALRGLDDYRAFRDRWKARSFAEGSAAVSATLALTGHGARSAALRAHGIPLAPDELAQDADAAAAAASRLGFPVAVKIESDDIPHKTEAGGVLLNLADAEAVRDAFQRVQANARRLAPGARIAGAVVQKMAPPGQEVIVGAIRDADFGPLLMLGLGGIHVEVLGDTVFEPVPLGPREAEAMIRRLRGVRLLEGVRGAPPADIPALVRLLVDVSLFLQAAGSGWTELELNPVLVHPLGEGLTVVDALIATGGASPHG
ncbi:acetate--CoA ligase family protein [Roseomonas sp. AR75]|uniref:acetate--CoA ligase family protein n=1 Tax=Roseomonas sp. AR75 TaxID=2562311 RepID=UPI0010C0EF8D|nr:acetate--CoA ligase family protein [Roseomonas sp. AR75]